MAIRLGIILLSAGGFFGAVGLLFLSFLLQSRNDGNDLMFGLGFLFFGILLSLVANFVRIQELEENLRDLMNDGGGKNLAVLGGRDDQT